MINLKELIVAVDAQGHIGSDGKLGFYEPHDMEWFKWYTMGKTLVAGRKTAESFGWHPETNPSPLPGRKLIVLSRKSGPTLEEVLALDESLCFIGGGELYNQVLPHVHRAVVTHLEAIILDADTKFNTGYLLKRFDRWCTIKRWDTARVTIYEHIRR